MTTEPAEPPYPKPLYAWYTIGVLMLAYAISYLDRNIISLLVQPMKADMQLSDTQVGLLNGLAFVALYTVAGLFMGRLVDATVRTRIIIAGSAFWSLMTIGCGFARTYSALFVCRMGVGVGEATLAPAAYSIVADCFPPTKRGFALSIYAIGIYIGQGLALIVGAFVLDSLMHINQVVVPVLGPVRNWQIVFIIVGLLGVPMGLLLFTLREPPRRLSPSSASKAGLPMPTVLKYHRENLRTFVNLNLCHALMAMAIFSMTAWVPTFFVRTYGASAADIGKAYGLILTIFGALGVIAGGVAGDIARNRGIKTGRMLVQTCAALCAVPFTIAYPLASNSTISLILLVPATFIPAFTVATHTPALLEILPNRMRGFSTSVSLLVSNILGIGLGSASVALFTDYVFKDEGLIAYSLAIVPSFTLSLAAIFGFLTLRPYVATLAYEGSWTDKVD